MLDGTEEYEMTLFYGARDRQHIAYQGELDAMAEKGLKVIYVLSDEKSAEQATDMRRGLLQEPCWRSIPMSAALHSSSAVRRQCISLFWMS